MLLCDSHSRSSHGRSGWLGVVLVFLMVPAVSGEDLIETDVIETESLWSADFPKVETQISWNWGGYLWPEGWWTQRNEDFSESALSQPSFGKLFGQIGWLSPKRESLTSELTSDTIIIRGENSGLGSGLFSEWRAAPDYQITLVRGGVPQLFGARGRLRGEYGDEFDDVKRIRGQMLLNLIGNHIGIDASVNSWEDHRPRPQSLGDFWTGDANLVYSLGAQRVAMRGGVGAAWVYDNDLDVGHNFTYGADLYLTRPWLLSGEVDWGQINSDKLFHWRATAGLQLLRFEIYVGYDSYKWDRIRFDGPVAGAGIWF